MSLEVRRVVPPTSNSISGLPLSASASWASRTYDSDKSKKVCQVTVPPTNQGFKLKRVMYKEKRQQMSHHL